jgi:hypothetical protein
MYIDYINNGMSDTHENIVEAIDSYLSENAKFEEKGVKAAATRARKALMDLKKLATTRRKEIQDKKNSL